MHAPVTQWRSHRRAPSTRCFSNAENGRVAVTFQLPYHCKYGQKMCLIGADAKLGAWNVAQAIPMDWTEGDVWVVDLQLPAEGSAELEYKYVVRYERDKSAVRWKEGGNFQLRLPTQGRLRVLDTWDESARKVEMMQAEAQQAAARPPPQAAAPAPYAAPPPPPAMAAPPPPVAPRPPAPAAPQFTAAAAPAFEVPQAVSPPAPAPAPLHAAPLSLEMPEAAAPAPARKTRRKKVDEDEQVEATISKAAQKAMQQLDSAVSNSIDLLAATSDPAAPELLAADRQVAAAAKRAATMNKALDAAREAKMLPPAGTKSGGQRRRRGSGRDGQGV